MFELSKGICMILVGAVGSIICLVLLCTGGHRFHKKKQELLYDIKTGERP